MMKVLYLTGIPSPYRVDLFNKMGKLCNLEVVFLAEYQSDRNKKWQTVKPETFQAVFINKGPLQDKKIDFGMKEYLKKNASQFDIIVVHGISFVASMIAMRWMIRSGIRYGLEADGAIIPKKEKKIKYKLKEYFIRHASFWLSSSKITTDRYLYYGAKENRCYHYPFTSITEKDIYRSVFLSDGEKDTIKSEVGFSYKKVVLTDKESAADFCFSDGRSRLNGLKESDVEVLVVGNSKEQNDNSGEFPDNVRFITDTDPLIMDYLMIADVYLSLGNHKDNMIRTASAYGVPVVAFTEESFDCEKGSDGLMVYGISSSDPARYDRLMDFLSDTNKQESYRIDTFRHAVNSMTDKLSDKDRTELLSSLWYLLNRKREIIKKEYGIKANEPVVLLVGQIIPRKGIDIMLEASLSLSPEIKYYVVGGACTEPLQQIIDAKHIENVQFVDFAGKEELRKYYSMCDVFALPTREDIWGLVINEAMAYCLPIVTTDNCVAGLELVSENWIIPTEDSDALAEKMKELFGVIGDREYNYQLIEHSLKTSFQYSIENSAVTHIEIFKTVDEDSQNKM
ncbi:MAG: glycosyltransferase family 4 protein [Ruminococcus sp.]|nr:glycosyltransferase family 4 protein [Ruminococcus sp.]